MKTIIALSISFNILLLVSLFDTSPAKQAAELAANPVTSDEGLITAITNNSQTDIQHSISEQRHKPFINTGPAVADNEASPRPPKLPDSRYTGIDFEALYKKIDSKPRIWAVLY